MSVTIVGLLAAGLDADEVLAAYPYEQPADEPTVTRGAGT